MQSYILDRVVLDTNIYISFILNNKLNKLIALIEQNDLEIFICEDLINEIISTLQKTHIKSKLKFPIQEYLEVIQLITTTIVIDKRFDNTIDPHDNFLFDLAYSCKSYFIITEDKPILNHKQINKIKIISMLAFKKLLNNNG